MCKIIAIADNDQINMCDTCPNDFAQCTPEVISFGNGYGSDNVIECSSYDGVTTDDITMTAK